MRLKSVKHSFQITYRSIDQPIKVYKSAIMVA